MTISIDKTSTSGPATRGATNAPMSSITAATPMPMFLTSVGKISDPYKYAILYAIVMNALPVSSITTVATCHSSNKLNKQNDEMHCAL